MKAIVATRSLPAEDPRALIDIELPDPTPGPRDLRVAVRAVSVNPVDTKVRRGLPSEDGAPRVLGFDAVGTVVETGPAVTRFKPGDRVWYAGDITRPGSNAQFQLVDERIVGNAPASLSDADAAALPLTAITAWELLFDRLRVPRDAAAQGSLLVVGAAGGVGSILVQLARQLTGYTVIGSASRPETRDWVQAMGAHHVVDHAQPLAAQVLDLVPGGVSVIAGLTHTDRHFEQYVDAIAPQGAIGIIDDSPAFDVRLLKSKSASLHWEMMFARPRYGTPDIDAQGTLLDAVARLIDAGRLRSTATQRFDRIDADTLRRAHARVESGRTIGKVVLAGF